MIQEAFRPRPSPKWAARAALPATVEEDLADAPVQGTSLLLDRMTNNLIDNAIRHNQPGGWIRVTARSEGTLAWLVVESGGLVLDERDAREPAQPFRRLGGDRTSIGDGIGLGLSIVAAIAEAHNGTLQLHARADGGLCAAVTLPTAARALAGVAG